MSWPWLVLAALAALVAVAVFICFVVGSRTGIDPRESAHRYSGDRSGRSTP